jgi:hypothetical protein
MRWNLLEKILKLYLAKNLRNSRKESFMQSAKKSPNFVKETVKSDVMEFATIIFSKKFAAILSGPTPLMQSQVSTGSHS